MKFLLSPPITIGEDKWRLRTHVRGGADGDERRPRTEREGGEVDSSW